MQRHLLSQNNATELKGQIPRRCYFGKGQFLRRNDPMDNLSEMMAASDGLPREAEVWEAAGSVGSSRMCGKQR